MDAIGGVLPLPAAATLSASGAPGTYGPTGAMVRPGSKVSAAQMAAVDKTAKEYEAGFVSAMLESMFAGIKTNKLFGGGSGEDMFRSLLNQEYGKAISERGSLGIADAIKREMLRLQEVH